MLQEDLWQPNEWPPAEWDGWQQIAGENDGHSRLHEISDAEWALFEQSRYADDWDDIDFDSFETQDKLRGSTLPSASIASRTAFAPGRESSPSSSAASIPSPPARRSGAPPGTAARSAGTPRHPQRGRQISERRLLQYLKRILKMLNLKGHLHTFKHNFVSHALTCGVPRDIVRNWVGTISDDVLDYYTHISDAASHEAMRRLAESNGQVTNADAEFRCPKCGHQFSALSAQSQGAKK